jgi:hypothetical protein
MPGGLSLKTAPLTPGAAVDAGTKGLAASSRWCIVHLQSACGWLHSVAQNSTGSLPLPGWFLGRVSALGLVP